MPPLSEPKITAGHFFLTKCTFQDFKTVLKLGVSIWKYGIFMSELFDPAATSKTSVALLKYRER